MQNKMEQQRGVTGHSVMGKRCKDARNARACMMDGLMKSLAKGARGVHHETMQ